MLRKEVCRVLLLPFVSRARGGKRRSDKGYSKWENPLGTLQTPSSARRSNESSVSRPGSINEMPTGHLEVAVVSPEGLPTGRLEQSECSLHIHWQYCEERHRMFDRSGAGCLSEESTHSQVTRFRDGAKRKPDT